MNWQALAQYFLRWFGIGDKTDQEERELDEDEEEEDEDEEDEEAPEYY